ncbi:MAG: carboxylating nicotinate-nucleotide diphosphorylase [Steroidobacterales bacterium]
MHGRTVARTAVLRVATPADLPLQVERALAEDIGPGDVTAGLIPPDRQGLATVITRERAVMCGRPYVDAVYAQLDARVHVQWFVAEGAWAEADQTLFTVSGPARILLMGERTALNFVQLLSATATIARRYATLIEGTGCRVLDTRKTIPGLRTAQKYAVRVGGASNHRVGLYDGILIKENHIAAAGSIAAAVAAARRLQLSMPVEVEVEDVAELREAIEAQADIALLDNFSLALMHEAVAMNRAARKPIKLEASGGVSEESIRTIALTGVDFVSVGAITKNVRAIDLSMRFG